MGQEAGREARALAPLPCSPGFASGLVPCLSAQCLSRAPFPGEWYGLRSSESPPLSRGLGVVPTPHCGCSLVVTLA